MSPTAINLRVPHPHPVEIHSGVWGWALEGDTRGWALLGDPGAGALGLGTPRRLCGWALGTPGRHSGLGTQEETLGLGTPGKIWGWALQGDSGFGHSGTLSRLGEEKSSERGEEFRARGKELRKKSNNPTQRVGNNP